MPNKFIVFEGIDGAGKATQVKLLEKRFRAQGKRIAVFSSPRYETPTGKLIKAALRGALGNFLELNAYLSAAPYLLDFAAERDELAAALKRGTVVSDRYIPSTLAFHSAKLPKKERKAFIGFVENFLYRDLKLPRPTRVIYLDTPVAAAQRMIRGKKKDVHEKSASYQTRVAEAYRELSKRRDWKLVPSTKGGKMRSPAEIHELVWKAVQ